MRDRPLSEVHLGDGEEGGFWTVSFDDLQLRHADVETGDMRSICVHVDEATGELSLSDGYEPRSRQHADENSLFREFRDAIVREMVADRRFADRAAFHDRVRDDAFRRDESLAALDVDLAELSEDDED